MQNPRPLYSLLQLIVGAVLLALILRTWLVMGLIEPVQVAGSSMAPTLCGQHLLVTCPECKTTLDFASEFSQTISEVPCHQCGKQHISLQRVEIRPGDNLFVDRQSLAWNPPQRGELVVLRNPTDGQELSVKRVWGLPGEAIELRAGDVFVDGQPFWKPLELQRTLRRLVHQEVDRARRWHSDSDASWNWKAESWSLNAKDAGSTHWLRYEHPNDRPITDDYHYNANLTRRLYPACDLMVSGEFKLQGEGELFLELHGGEQLCRIGLSIDQKTASITLEGIALISTEIPDRLMKQLQDGGLMIEFSNFDRQLFLAIDSQVLVQAELPSETLPAKTSQPFAIGAKQLDAELRNLRVYRDVYFTPQAVGLAPAARRAINLGPAEYFLLGDNSPVSVDSRSWGGVPERLFLGRPLGIR